jgi:hypothetical protein
VARFPALPPLGAAIGMGSHMYQRTQSGNVHKARAGPRSSRCCLLEVTLVEWSLQDTAVCHACIPHCSIQGAAADVGTPHQLVGITGAALEAPGSTNYPNLVPPTEWLLYDMILCMVYQLKQRLGGGVGYVSWGSWWWPCGLGLGAPAGRRLVGGQRAAPTIS